MSLLNETFRHALRTEIDHREKEIRDFLQNAACQVAEEVFSITDHSRQQRHVIANENKTQSKGEIIVGSSHNPTGNKLINEIKTLSAKIIDFFISNDYINTAALRDLENLHVLFDKIDISAISKHNNDIIILHAQDHIRDAKKKVEFLSKNIPYRWMEDRISVNVCIRELDIAQMKAVKVLMIIESMKK